MLLVGLALRPVPQGGVELSLIVCTGLDLGGGIPDGLGSCGGGPSDRPSRSLRVAPSGFRPGTRPAHPGPAHRGASAVALQVVGELGGGVLAAPAGVESSGIPSPPVVCGRLRAAISIASHTRGSVPRAVAPVASPTAFLVQQPGTVARQIEPSRVRIQVDIAHPPALPAGRRREPAPDLVRARAPGPGGPGAVAPSPFGVAAAWRALLTHGRVRTVSGLVSTPLRAPAAWTLRYPQGGAGAVEDPLDQGAELFPASHGS